jgi:hypothetical protein
MLPDTIRSAYVIGIIVNRDTQWHNVDLTSELNGNVWNWLVMVMNWKYFIENNKACLWDIYDT